MTIQDVAALETWSAAQAALVTGISRERVAEAYENGEIVVHYPARERRALKSDVMDWIRRSPNVRGGEWS
jgi:hypothetical protein